MTNNRSILLIYTGGTIGMKQDPETLSLKPFDFGQILEEVPELKKFGYRIDNISFDPIIDSSDVKPDVWVEIARIIQKRYEQYDGFVVLHGTDTMAYSASALSFMLSDLEKPVIFTGSQLPIGVLRTDGRENLISSIEIAAAWDESGHAIVPEVCIYFENRLYRGNRTTKYNAEDFRAFRSANFPPLAEVGIHIKYNTQFIRYPEEWGRKLKIHTDLDTRVAILKIFPGISREYVEAILGMGNLKAIVLETYGSGNSLSDTWFLEALLNFDRSNGVIVNVTQCKAGSVDMSAYANGTILKDAGVIGGNDITVESALTKLFILLGENSDNAIIKRMLSKNLKGEISDK